MKKLLFLILLAALAAGCSRQAMPAPSIPAEMPYADSESSVSESMTEKSDVGSSTDDWDLSIPVNTPQEQPANPASNEYLNELVAQAIATFAAPEMTEYERAKAAFDYIIEHTYLDEPIGLELWRVHGGGDDPIPFVEQRALSPLRFGVGMCEDYAAALTLLLRGLGLEAQYVPGLTYSLEGHLVDHAWTMVRINGVWYHLDSQLEDNISIRRGTVRYRYFLKGDVTLSASHLWGQRLIDSSLLTAEQNAELSKHYLVPACPQDYATPEPHKLGDTAAPDLEALRAEAGAELAAYEEEHGAPPLTLDTIPPIFGLEGFGPPDEG